MTTKAIARAPLNYNNLFWITLVHLVALAAIPFFTWPAFVVCMVGVFVLAPIGINVGYHRLLTHRSFKTSKFVKYGVATLGAALGAGPPIHWVAMHRVHHKYSDGDKDPHNSTRGFWYSHILHLFVMDEQEAGGDHLERFAPDLMADPYMAFLNKHWLWCALATLPLLYLAGGVPFLLWGGFVRLALSWHIMWFVNSASHMWGYRNYETTDKTVNCWWVGILAAGEGWHNNHHAQPTCAAHGHKWWELDMTFWVIRALEMVGLATEVKRPARASQHIIS
ncbi:MAG: acyl-CoA desaturase [Bdellovibrionota bacterium]